MQNLYHMNFFGFHFPIYNQVKLNIVVQHLFHNCYHIKMPLNNIYLLKNTELLKLLYVNVWRKNGWRLYCPVWLFQLAMKLPADTEEEKQM